MAFNLNKNEAVNPSAKFDLSKSDPSGTVATAEEKPKSKTWLFALLGLLAIGIGAWYFLSPSGDAPKQESDIATSVPANTNNNTNAPNAVANDTANITTVNNNHSTEAASVDVSHINNKVPATFAKGSNTISGLDQSLVKDIIAFLQKNPGSVITVNGYASSEGTLAVNQAISQSRANAFKKYLVSKGIPAGSINATGKGINNPVASNDTEEGRIKNRRVEISFQ